MAEERERKPYQPEAQAQEPQLPQPEVGQRAYDLIQDSMFALENTPEFQQRFQEQKAMWERSGYPDAMLDNWNVDFDKGLCHYNVHFNHYPEAHLKTRVG